MKVLSLMRKLKKNGIDITLRDNDLEIHYNGDELSDAVIAELKNNKQQIIAFLRQMNNATDHEIPAAQHQLNYPLSSSQLRLWILSRMDEANVAYNLPDVYVFEGALNTVALSMAVRAIIERHEILRTVFREDEQGQVRQLINAPEKSGFDIEYHDVREEDPDAVKNLIRQDFIKPFDLAHGPLLRVSLYLVEDSKWVLAYVMHHIISDAWSMDILVKELLTLYNVYINGQTNPFPPLRIHYKDYAVWQQQQLSSEAFQVHKEYWLKQFSGELPVLQLVGDCTRPSVKTYNGRTTGIKINAALTKNLKLLCKEQGATLFMGLLAAVKTLLHRYTGQDDIVIGSPIAGREHTDLENQIGFYINTVAIRTRFKGQNSYRQLLENIMQVTLGAYEHQAYPFDELVNDLNLQRDRSRNPLFDVWVVLQSNEMNKPGQQQTPDEVKISGYSGAGFQLSRFDLHFNFIEIGDEIYAGIIYNTDIYFQSTIEQLANHLVQLLHVITDNADMPILQLDYLSAHEKSLLLKEGNDAPLNAVENKNVIQLFEEQVLKTPENIALVFEGRRLTYSELNEKANRLGNYLREKYRIVPNDLIAMKLERSEWSIIALLGILKSGAAYVPIDLDYPAERVEYMLSNSRCAVLIDENELRSFKDVQKTYSSENPEVISRPNDLVYVIYTSGSTGLPKGVMVSNKALVDYFYGILNRTNVSDCKSFALVSTLAADLGNTIIFTSILIGGELHVFTGTDVMNLERMLKMKTDCLKIVPSHWKALQKENGLFVPDKCLLFGGEALTQDIIQLLKAHQVTCTVYNHYGPTETTIGKLVKHIDLQDPNLQISLGTPIGNNQVYILDANRRLVPRGVVGEIYIGGDGLAKGYLNKPELTAERFVSNPFRDGEIIYKTGDLGRWLPDNTVEYIGRKDDQVKIRGFRIEPGEIERTILDCDGITSAVVVVREEATGEKQLVAYITGPAEINIDGLKKYLGKKLPAYMIPLWFVQLEKLPLTANGKTDKKMLPLPGEWAASQRTAIVAPRNETEQNLVVIWSEVLGIEIEKIGIKDNFFELGGHSLKAIRIVLRIHELFNVEIDLANLFNEPTIESLATEIENIKWIQSSPQNDAVIDKTII